MRELYLNVDLKGCFKDEQLKLNDDNVYYNHFVDDGSSLGISVDDVDIFIKAGIIREVLPKWADDDLALEMLKYY